MENNFYVGCIFHRKKLRASYVEQTVLYTEDDYEYLDLLKSKYYNINTKEKDYVIRDSLIPTDVDNYQINYKYLLEKHKSRKKIKS